MKKQKTIAKAVQPYKSVGWSVRKIGQGTSGMEVCRGKAVRGRKLEVVRQEANLGEAALRLGVSGQCFLEYQQDI